MKPLSSAEVTSLKLEGCIKSSRDLEELVQHVRTQAKKKHVTVASAAFRFSPELVLLAEVQDRGARMRVPGRGVYAFTLDGLMNAVADVIREEHGSDPALLDVYEQLLRG